MSYHSKEIFNRVWQITDHSMSDNQCVNMYLIEGTRRSLLVDAGYHQKGLKNYLKTLTDLPIDLVITHGHMDHAGALNEFKQSYISKVDINILTNHFKMNIHVEHLNDLNDGDVFDLGDVVVETIVLPGHTKGSVVLLDENRGLLFSSDGLGNRSVWLQLPHSSSIETYHSHLIKLKERVKDVKQLKIFVGHSSMKYTHYELSRIDELIKLTTRILINPVVGQKTLDKSRLFGGLKLSNEAIKEFIYKADNVYNKI